MICIFEIIVGAIVVFFPLMIYYFYLAYKKNLRESERYILVNLCLLFTIFASMLLLDYFDNSYYYFFTLIPILFCYMYKRELLVIFSLLNLSIYLYIELNVGILYLILANLLFFVNYMIYKKFNLSKRLFTFLFYVIVFILGVCYFIKNGINGFFDFTFLMTLFIFGIIMLVVEILINKASEVINLHLTLKEFEREKVIQSSFFKITHEIKNPISVCKGYLDMFDAKNTEKSIKYINIIKGEIDRTLALLDDFKQFTKITIEKKYFDVGVLLEDVNSAISLLSNKYKVKIDLNYESNISVYADYNRLKQVIINLVKNGIEANIGNSNGRVMISAYTDGDKVYIIVKDNGEGMSKEEMEKLLVPFHTTKQTGTGLGVVFSNEIINAHGGKLKYTSKLGSGTTAKIILSTKKS